MNTCFTAEDRIHWKGREWMWLSSVAGGHFLIRQTEDRLVVFGFVTQRELERLLLAGRLKIVAAPSSREDAR
ncbi:hypothetical protein ACTZWW_08470 [Salinarimonas sp. NSM]|uniref:hypothetical protein n=1 Tax=Salinarimonas sp. NSM TaxID=3458003 RepID=UPI0040361907